jgi:hypothetical protein
MTNEMMRPCTLWGYTFDAMRVKIVEINMAISSEPFQVWVEVWEENPDGATPITHKKCFSENEIIIANREAITTIADALNAPVLATEEVLAGLPKDAKVYTFDEKTGDALRCTFDNEFGWVCRTGHFNEALKLGRPYRIFTINDPKTAEYLRQFTREGVRRVGNA